MKRNIITLLLAAAVLPIAAQRISVQKSTIDCGVTAYERPVTAVFELENKEHHKLHIKNVRVSCGCLVAEYPEETIRRGGKFTLKLTYDARQLGHFEKTAALYTDVSDKPLYLTMKGVVRSGIADYSGSYPYKVGNLRADKLDLEFDDVNKGDHPVQEIYLVNEGTKSLMPNLMHLPPYLTAIATPEILRPGKAGKLTVTLNSERLRDYGLTQTTVYLANEPGDKIGEANEIGVSAVLLHGFDNITEATKQFAPKLSLSAKELNISFDGKAKKTKKVTITNGGRTALKIQSLQMFTHGMKVTLNKREIKPGEKATLKVTVMRDELKKVRTKPRVLMITNDPDNAKVIINVNAK